MGKCIIVITVEDHRYELITNYKDAFDLEEFSSRYTDYFYDYDYILGDIAYSKLRLKGFYDSDNVNAKEINDIKYLDNYLKNYCAHDCKYFVLKQAKD